MLPLNQPTSRMSFIITLRSWETERRSTGWTVRATLPKQISLRRSSNLLTNDFRVVATNSVWETHNNPRATNLITVNSIMHPHKAVVGTSEQSIYIYYDYYSINYKYKYIITDWFTVQFGPQTCVWVSGEQWSDFATHPTHINQYWSSWWHVFHLATPYQIVTSRLLFISI